MFLKNLKEDMVIKAIKDVFKDMPDICKCPICVEDIATYALNRMTAYYINSGRGILHLEKDILPYIQDQADIYTLVLQAIKIIHDRRKGHKHNLAQNGLEILERAESELADGFYLNFPYLIGRVLDYVSMRPREGIIVDLFIYNEEKKQYVICPMKDPSWINPYVIPNALEGYFAFWPAPQKANSQGEFRKESINFKIVVNDDEYEEEFSLDILSDKVIKHHISTRNVHQLENILI